VPIWSNWSGRHQAKPTGLVFARSEAHLTALIREAAASGVTVRAAGAGHSHAPLVPCDGVVIDTSALSGVVAADATARTARVRAGTPIYALGPALHAEGLALVNQGDIDRQAIAGACATGTHGTGTALRNLSSAVVGARLVLASGEVVDCHAGQDPELWQGVRLNLGAFGVVTELTLALRDAYRLTEQAWSEPLDALLPRVPALTAGHRHFEFFWYPQDDRAVAKAIDETAAPPIYPLAEEGGRVGWSYEVLPNHRPHRHTEMEYCVSAPRGLDCLAELRTLIRTSFPDVRWPIEYRTLAADDVWLSTAYGRDGVTISVHQDIREDDEPYFRACEAVFLNHGGRPHWGKVHYLSGRQLADRHPPWIDWWSQRDRADPGGTFLNDHLRTLRAP
jgi:FAD/FMN-containing dehydrogenase